MSESRKCLICLVSFTTKRNAKFCSRKCIERNNTLKLNPDAAVVRTEADYQRACECCGKSYINKSLRYGNKYCSRQCANHINLHVAKGLNDNKAKATLPLLLTDNALR